MSKWNYELTIDIAKEEYVLYLIETSFRIKPAQDVSSTHQLDRGMIQRKRTEIRRFHKDCDMDWMVKEMNNHTEILNATFVPSDTYELEFVGDRFIGNYESNILLIKDRIDRKEVIVIGKTFSLIHGETVIKALNEYKKEIVE